MRIFYTIGYEDTDISRFTQTLISVGVDCLVDVRAVAISRKKGFSKTKLAAHLFEHGIEYLHFKELGDPKEGRDAARAGKYDDFKKIFRAHLKTESARAAMSSLTIQVETKNVCLMCFERDPLTCHRTLIADQLTKSVGLSKFDLYGDLPERYARKREHLPRNNSYQSHTAR